MNSFRHVHKLTYIDKYTGALTTRDLTVAEILTTPNQFAIQEVVPLLCSAVMEMAAKLEATAVAADRAYSRACQAEHEAKEYADRPR